MTAATAQRRADIESKANMLAAKLVPANAANITRITMRSAKRTITWMDGIEPGRFSDCLTSANPRDASVYEKFSQESGWYNGLSFRPAAGTLVRLDGELMYRTSTKALRMASARSTWRPSTDASSQSGSSSSRDSAQYHSPSS